jgi:hypothetical protein
MGLQYAAGFVRDSSPRRASRIAIAAEIARRIPGKGDAVLASRDEPAPWSLPPVDLFRWRIVLPPLGFPPDRPYQGATLTVGPADFPPGAGASGLLLSTPISWAAKPFPIQAKDAAGW